MPFRFRALNFRIRPLIRPALYSCLFLTAGSILLPAQTACPAAAGWVKPVPGDLFTDEQEVWLGDAMADSIESYFPVIKDPTENAYLEKIGARLLAAIPPTRIRFRFVLIESADVNGFSLAGGRVYLTRKLVASAHSEDEIAGVLAHEIGHIVTHQSAADISHRMRRLMGVTSIGDRADVYDKFRRLMDAVENEKKWPEDPDTDSNQNQADRVAVYAMAVAGYQTQALPEFLDRSFFVQGKTGNSLSDFFGQTKPSQKRLRHLRLLVAELPKGCGAPAVSATAEFHQLQTLVTANQKPATIAETESAARNMMALQPPLQMDLQGLRFSRDGKYLFAQDESSIFVLQRNPINFLFRFNAENARPAQWSPDSTKIVFYTPELHFEEWSVTQEKLLSAREVVVKDDCIQTVQSPDGRTLACVSVGEPSYMTSSVPFNLSFIDIESGQSIYQKNSFFFGNAHSVWLWRIRRETGQADDPLCSAISQDGNYLIIGVGDGKVAFDLRSRTPVKLGGDFNRDISGAFAFEEQAIVGENLSSPKDSGWFSFPDGKRLGKTPMNFPTLNGVSKGDYMVTRGGEHNNTILLNIATQKGIELPHVHTLDMWGNSIVTEAPDGAVVLGTFDGAKPIQVLGSQVLPQSPLGSTKVVELSPDGRYLAVSGKSRGAVWDLKSGNRLYNLRGFTGATFHPDGNLYLDLPKFDKVERAVMRASLDKNALTKVDYSLTDEMLMRAGRMMEWNDQGKGKFLLTVRDPASGKEQWNRTFEKEKPASARNYADNNLLFMWKTSSSAGKAELKSKPELDSQFAALRDKDAGLLVEVVSIDNGEVIKSVVLERPSVYNGIDDLDQVQDTFLLDTSDNRVLFFSAKTGVLAHQVFGYVVGVDRQAGLICVKNRGDEALVYDLNANEVSHVQVGTNVRFAKFKNDGKKLLLLGADQKIREVDLDQKTIADAAERTPHI